MAPLTGSYRARNPNANFWGAMGMSLLALVLAFAIGYVGFVLSVGSIGLAWRSRVDDRHPLSSVAIAFAVLCTVLAVVVRVWREFR